MRCKVNTLSLSLKIYLDDSRLLTATKSVTAHDAVA
jgi:hypothetical protein